MKKLLIAITLFLIVHFCGGQVFHINNGVDTLDKKVAIAIDFYKRYLGDIKFDTLPDFKKYWSTKDIAQNKMPDPTLYAITDFPTYLMSESKTITYANSLKEYVHLKILFASADSLKNIEVTCITNHYVGFNHNGNPYFINPTDIYTKSWKVVKRRNITYIYSPYHLFNLAKADSLIAKMKILEKDWGVKPIAIRYYLTDTKEELSQLKGLDFINGIHNNNKPSGNSDDQNDIIYASGLGEGYFHEVVHMYLNRKFERSPLREGLATFYGGSFGKELTWHLKYLNDYLEKHPEIDLNNFQDFHYIDDNTNPYSTITGMLCFLAYQKGGLKGLKCIMNYTSFEDIFLKEFNVQPGQWNRFIRDNLQKK